MESTAAEEQLLSPEVAFERLQALRENLARVIHGKADVIDLLMIAMLSNGSVLMEDVPGVGKTTLAKALARSIDVPFRRVQFTPDLLPSDILGSSIYNPVDGQFTFRPGPIFCNVLLADEINRASPRTQSALLEAMSEGQATIEGTSHALPDPFLVLATQNPVEYHGTYPLPEAQLDRFMLHLNLGYPDPKTEVGILYAQAESHPISDLRPVLDAADVVALQASVRRVHVDATIAGYIVELVRRTREDERLKLGISPRGSLMLFRAAQAAAFVEGRDYALPDDVQRMAVSVLAHRLLLASRSQDLQAAKHRIIREIVDQTSVPA